MGTIYKTFKAEIKGVNADEGTVDMLIPVSTASVDRDGEIVEPNAFKKTLPKFMKRPVLVSSHDYRDLTSQIGEWTKLKITENGVEGKPKYYINEGNEQADWGFKLASKGMAAFSIGFIPKVWEDGDGVKEPRRTYKEVELLEISQVIVPSNREAIQSIRSKSVDPIITEICDEVESELEPEITKEIITKPEETDNMYRIPVPGEVGKHTDHKIRTIDIDKDKGIKALYCVDDKKNITYMFDKDKWDSMEAARAWMMAHMPKSHEVSQSEIIDEIDYLKSLIEKEGLSEEAENSAIDLINILASNVKGKENPYLTGEYKKRISGGDIPVEDKESITYQEIQEAVKRIAKKQEVT